MGEHSIIRYAFDKHYWSHTSDFLLGVRHTCQMGLPNVSSFHGACLPFQRTHWNCVPCKLPTRYNDGKEVCPESQLLDIAQWPVKQRIQLSFQQDVPFHVSLSISLLLSPCVTGHYGWFVGCGYRCVFVPSFFYAEGSCQTCYCKNSWLPPSSSGISRQRYCTLFLFQQNFVRFVCRLGVSLLPATQLKD